MIADQERAEEHDQQNNFDDATLDQDTESNLIPIPISNIDDKPGDCILVDMIHLPIRGLLPQQYDKPHIDCFCYDYIFVLITSAI